MATCVTWDLDPGCCDEWDSLEPALTERATDLAWRTLNILTGGRVGACPVTMRPCLSEPCGACTQWQPALVNGAWVNNVCGRPECSCKRLCEIVFPSTIAVVVEVMLDGIVLDPSLFVIHNGHRLVRTDGECWPSCQDLTRPVGDVGTLGITYVPGVDPGTSGAWAAGVLACEFTKACSGQKCRLPQAVTSVSRPGITFEVAQGMFPGGLTGIREVDAFILAVNPYTLQTASTVWSPDVSWAKHRYETPA